LSRRLPARDTSRSPPGSPRSFNLRSSSPFRARREKLQGPGARPNPAHELLVLLFAGSDVRLADFKDIGHPEGQLVEEQVSHGKAGPAGQKLAAVGGLQKLVVDLLVGGQEGNLLLFDPGVEVHGPDPQHQLVHGPQQVLVGAGLDDRLAQQFTVIGQPEHIADDRQCAADPGCSHFAGWQFAADCEIGPDIP
jgi:hypothetical protein